MADDDRHDFEVVAAGGRLTARRDSFARRRAGALRTLVSVALPVWVADVVTKRLAVAGLQPPHLPHQVLGETVRLTLAYNQQGVMGLPVGPYGRWILSAVSIALLGLLVHLLKTAYHPGRATALALMIGGGCGNLLDRLASSRGVVDFIDLGYGGWRFWTFNVADVAIDVGVALFAWMWWRTGRSAPPPAPPEKVAA